MRYKLNERIDIHITRTDPNFDRACDSALQYALRTFGADDDGHLNNVVNHERSTDAIQIVFLSLRMVSSTCNYKFVAWVERNND